MAHIKERPTRRGKRYDVRQGNESRAYPTLEAALLAQIAVERGDGFPPTRVLPDSLTVGEFMDDFHARWRIGKAAKTLEIAASARRHLADLDSVRLTQLRASLVEDLIASLAGTAPRAAQQALAHLQKGLRSAQARGHQIDPRLLQLRPPGYESKEIRFLTWPEVEALQAFLDAGVQRIVPFAALTGMRKGELFDLTDKQVDLSAGTVTLRERGTKTRRSRQVWLSEHALQLLREQLVARTPNARGLVFPTRTGHRLDSRFELAYRQAVDLAGLTEPRATFHSLRHTCAALMIRAGCNAFEVAEQLGHVRGGRPDPTMVWKVYGWLFENATRNAVKRLDVLIREDTAREATA